MTSTEILVVFLSTALGIFLLLAIVLVVYLIIIAKRIKAVTEAAQRTVSHFENIASIIGKTAAPAMISRFVMETLQGFMKRRNKDEKEK